MSLIWILTDLSQGVFFTPQISEKVEPHFKKSDVTHWKSCTTPLKKCVRYQKSASKMAIWWKKTPWYVCCHLSAQWSAPLFFLAPIFLSIWQKVQIFFCRFIFFVDSFSASTKHPPIFFVESTNGPKFLCRFHIFYSRSEFWERSERAKRASEVSEASGVSLWWGGAFKKVVVTPLCVRALVR